MAAPPRGCRRLQSSSGWSDGRNREVLAGGPRTSGSHGLRAREPAPLSRGDGTHDRGEERLLGRSAVQVGAAGRDRSGPTAWRIERRAIVAEGARAGERRASARKRDPPQGLRASCSGRAQPPTEVMVAFIDEHREAYGVGTTSAGSPIGQVPPFEYEAACRTERTRQTKEAGLDGPSLRRSRGDSGASPASPSGRREMGYGRGKWVLVSPRDEEAFCAAMKPAR